MLELRGVSAGYDTGLVLRDVSITVPSASVVALHATVALVWHELSSALPSYRQTVATMREWRHYAVAQ